MKDLEFKDHTTRYTDADGDEHETTVRAAVVTADTARVKNDQGNPVAREVMTATGPRRITEGDVLVETDRPGVYDYLTADQWSDVGYETSDVEPAQNRSDAVWADETPLTTEPYGDATPNKETNPNALGDTDTQESPNALRKLSGNDNS